MPDLQVIWLLHLTLTAACFDLLHERIPNWLTYGGILCGLFAAGWAGLRSRDPLMLPASLAGVILPPILLGILFYFRMLGAGDIKLLSMIGAFLGADALLSVLFLSFTTGAVIAAARFVRYGNALSRFQYFFSYMADYIRTGVRKPYTTAGDHTARVCFAVPVLAGLMMHLAAGALR